MTFTYIEPREHNESIMALHGERYLWVFDSKNACCYDKTNCRFLSRDELYYEQTFKALNAWYVNMIDMYPSDYLCKMFGDPT